MEMIQKRALRTGDGTHWHSKEVLNGRPGDCAPERDVDHFWGWNDELMTAEDKKDVTIINKTEDVY